MKICKSCLKEKELDKFYKHSGMTDGRLNICKECKRIYMKKRITSGFTKEIESKRNKKRQKLITERSRIWRIDNPEKYKAHNKVNYAIKAGKLIKPNCCEECENNEKLHAHHDDYSKPLKVKWLCVKCHGKRNPNYKPLELYLV